MHASRKADDYKPAVYSTVVCLKCKSRKRKCDKALPSCRYCSQNRLHCYYRSVEPTRHYDQNHGSARESITEVNSLSPGMELPYTNPVVLSSRLLFEGLMQHKAANNSLGQVSAAFPSTVDAALSMQAKHVVRSSGQLPGEVITRYFKGPHYSIPFISQERLLRCLPSTDANPRADTALLLLTMCLLTYHPELMHQRAATINSTTLYVATRSLFAQAQGLCQPSLHLVQAGITLAVFEYARFMPDQAFITISCAARMAHAAHLKPPSSFPTHSTAYTDLQFDEEVANTWWGVLICERTFACELGVLNQPLVSGMPPAVVLPLPSAQGSQCLAMPKSNINGFGIRDAYEGPLAISPSMHKNKDGFARAGQAAWLLDQVLKTPPQSDLDQALSQMLDLGSEIQSFLAILMEQCHGTWGVYCGAIAISIRTLFLLHWRVLSHLHHGGPGVVHQEARKKFQKINEISQSALDSATKMVIDIAESHKNVGLDMFDMLPPSCAYIIRAALKHIDETRKLPTQGSLFLEEAESMLQSSLEQFNYRWSEGRML